MSHMHMHTLVFKEWDNETLECPAKLSKRHGIKTGKVEYTRGHHDNSDQNNQTPDQQTHIGEKNGSGNLENVVKSEKSEKDEKSD